MDELLDLAAAINTLYKYIYWEMEDKDFIPLAEEHYIRLPVSERNKKWYVINPFKIKKYRKETLVVDEKDKKQLLAAVRLICAISQQLGDTALFRERLLYCKSYLPSCIFTQPKKIER